VLEHHFIERATMDKIDRFKKEVLFETEESISSKYSIDHISSKEVVLTDKVSKDRFVINYG
jgi:hypothetical protein